MIKTNEGGEVVESRKYLYNESGQLVSVELLQKNGILLNQAQFDVLVSYTHQYGPNWWSIEPEKSSPYLLKKETIPRIKLGTYLGYMIENKKGKGGRNIYQWI